MKRTFVLILTSLAAAAMFGVLVHFVLVAAHVSQPAATTVHGPTARRLWATTAVLLALAGVVIGWLALAGSSSQIYAVSSRRRAVGAVAAGLIGSMNGGINLAVANGAGNGVIGGAAALLLGLIATALGGAALVRSGRDTTGPGRTA